jgi:two-component system sensor histidine kinase UhpB
VDLVVYRVAQEALTNALRHAAAAGVELGLRVVDGSLELSVNDDGRGLPGNIPQDTAGISGMRERASLVGGRLDLSSHNGQGTEVLLRIPLREGRRARS